MGGGVHMGHACRWLVNANFLPFLPLLLCSPQVDVSVADPTSIQGRALRVVTHTVHAVAGYTPFVGGQIRRLMIEIVSTAPPPPRAFFPPSFVAHPTTKGNEPDLSCLTSQNRTRITCRVPLA